MIKVSYKVFGLVLLTLVLSMLVVTSGALNLGFDRGALFRPNDLIIDVILDIRTPRMLMAAAAGGGLAVCGLSLQTWFKNQLADPFLLGIHSGASLGVSIYVLGLSSIVTSIPFLDSTSMVISGIIGALSVLLIMVLIASRFQGSVYIIIFGVVISFFITGLINLILSYSSSENLRHFFLWSLGSFDRTSLIHSILVFAFVIVITLNLYKHHNLLNVCLLGEDYALEAGVDLNLLKKNIIPSVGLISGMISVYCGPIIFVGLMAPHITKLIFLTSNHKVLIPASFLVGSCLCLSVCIFSSGYLFEYNLPINALLGLVGTPFVLILLVRMNLGQGRYKNV